MLLRFTCEMRWFYNTVVMLVFHFVFSQHLSSSKKALIMQVTNQIIVNEKGPYEWVPLRYFMDHWSNINQFSSGAIGELAIFLRALWSRTPFISLQHIQQTLESPTKHQTQYIDNLWLFSDAIQNKTTEIHLFRNKLGLQHQNSMSGDSHLVSGPCTKGKNSCCSGGRR